jgi:hypothetical protein
MRDSFLGSMLLNAGMRHPERASVSASNMSGIVALRGKLLTLPL